jgi:hypothetical protein
MEAHMYVGDLLPQLKIAVTADDVPVDLAVATAVTFSGSIDGVVLFSGRVATGKFVGYATMDWQTADTDTPGYVELELVATTGGKSVTYRCDDRLHIRPRLT